MPLINTATLTGDGSRWASIFRDIVKEHWANRMRSASPVRFVTELADDFVCMGMGSSEAALTAEALGGEWNTAAEIPTGLYREPIASMRSPQEIAYSMVADRFADMGPFRVETFASGEAFFVSESL